MINFYFFKLCQSLPHSFRVLLQANMNFIKIITLIFDGFKRKEKTAAIFFDIEKAYDTVNRDKTLEQLENMGIQGRMLRFIRELIAERWIKERIRLTEQADRLGNSTGRSA